MENDPLNPTSSSQGNAKHGLFGFLHHKPKPTAPASETTVQPQDQHESAGTATPETSTPVDAGTAASFGEVAATGAEVSSAAVGVAPAAETTHGEGLGFLGQQGMTPSRVEGATNASPAPEATGDTKYGEGELVTVPKPPAEGQAWPSAPTPPEQSVQSPQPGDVRNGQ